MANLLLTVNSGSSLAVLIMLLIVPPAEQQTRIHYFWIEFSHYCTTSSLLALMVEGATQSSPSTIYAVSEGSPP